MRTFVLTLWQPWATLLAYGVKQNETRVRAAKYNPEDRIIIHAAKARDAGMEAACRLKGSIYHRGLQQLGIASYNDLPFGALVGEFKVKEFATVKEEADNSLFAMAQLSNGKEVDDFEELLGDYNFGRSIWLGTDHRPLVEPIPYLNGQGYYQKLNIDYRELKFK